MGMPAVDIFNKTMRSFIEVLRSLVVLFVQTESPAVARRSAEMLDDDVTGDGDVAAAAGDNARCRQRESVT